MPVVDALCAAAESVLPDSGPLGGALVEETGLVARWLVGPGVRIVRAGADADAGWTSPLAGAGRFAAWAAAARSARLAAEQDLGADSVSDALREPHPTREQVFGGPGVERFGSAGQTRLPRGHPFGVAG